MQIASSAPPRYTSLESWVRASPPRTPRKRRSRAVPTYDYQCEACGHAFEKFQTMTARVLRKCPDCGASKLQRLIGPGAGFLFKGDGFYQTDYRSQSYKDGAKSSPDTKVPDGAASTDTPAKPDAAATSTDKKPSAAKKKADKD